MRRHRLPAPDSSPVPDDLGLLRSHPVVALAGSTTPIDAELGVRLLPVLRAVVATAADVSAALVTGGTDAGVIHLLGLAVESAPGRPAALIGVCPDGMLGPGTSGTVEIGPEQHHDILVTVPGQRWGDETPALSRTVDVVADGMPVVALLIGGGAGSRAEVVEHLRRGRALVVLSGTGRLADDITAKRITGDDDLELLLRTAAVTVLPVRGDPAEVARAVRVRLSPPRPRTVRERVPPLQVWPRLRLGDAAPADVLGPGTLAAHPLLADAFREANEIIGPSFQECDRIAAREQNRHRWFTVLSLIGGMATVVAAATQTWLPGAAWPGVVVATLGAATSALTTVARRQGARDAYLTARMRAERLRSLYFEHLARPPAVDDEQRRERLQVLAVAVAEHRYAPVMS